MNFQIYRRLPWDPIRTKSFPTLCFPNVALSPPTLLQSFILSNFPILLTHVEALLFPNEYVIIMPVDFNIIQAWDRNETFHTLILCLPATLFDVLKNGILLYHAHVILAAQWIYGFVANKLINACILPGATMVK